MFQVDVASGEGNMTTPGLITPIWFVGANLEVGERIFDTPWTPPEFSINRTEKIKLFGVQRYINVLNINVTMDTESENMSICGVMKWDKSTGVLIEAEGYMHFENETDYANIWCSAKINATSLWGETSHIVEVEGLPFKVTVFSNVSVYGMSINISERALIFRIRGLSGVCFCNISIPMNLMWGFTWEVYIDNQPIENFTITYGNNYTYIYFECALSEHEIKITSESIVPEFSSGLLTVIMLLALSAVAFTRKK